jgi:hypothetical protein
VRAPEQASGGFKLDMFDLPHRQQPTELKKHLAAGYLRELLDANPQLLAKPPEPGDTLAPRPNPAVGRELDRLVTGAAERLLTTTCAECHQLAPGEKIAPLPNRGTRLPGAKFDHARHRNVKCLDCHPGTQAAFAPGGKVDGKERVADNIRGIASCQSCHSPAGGVRHGCTDCHSYHTGSRVPMEPLGIADFLRK